MALQTGFNETIPNATKPVATAADRRHRVETVCDFLRIVRIANDIRFG
jgi:hypothetical protein